jgi:hypothetical protein
MLVHTINLTPAAGKTLINLPDWVATLPADQQAAYAAARAKQDAIDEANAKSGVFLGHEPGKVKWNDNAGDAVNNIDPDWKAFFGRYLEETGTTINVVVTNE